MSFSEKAKALLATYKVERLRIKQNGFYHGKEYSHILPTELVELNLFEIYRKEISQYIIEAGINLHQGFGHLNSSQAMALNFFYPFVFEKRLDLLAGIFGADSSGISNWAFEYVIDSNENTNFDFFLEMGSGQCVFFEIKYTEQFGTTANDASHQAKYSSIYEPRLKGKIKEPFLTAEYVFANYQILRNLSYLDRSKEDRVIFIYPNGNEHAASRLDNVIGAVVENDYRGFVQPITWETLVVQAEKALLNDNNHSVNSSLLVNLKLFKEKYLF